MVGVAVNVTLVPEHIVVAVAPMLTLTGRFAFTVITTELEVAGLPVAQLALEVITQVTMSAFTNVELEYVGESMPTFAPFNFH